MKEQICPVVKIEKTGKHPNADTLRIWNGPQGPIVFKDGNFADGSLAVFVPLDSIVDCSRSEFSFLKADKEGQTTCRVRAIKLRGKPSVGLLVPVPEGFALGDNAAPALGVTKYVPPPTHSFGTDSNAVKAPSDVYGLPVYDVENVWNIDKFSTDDAKVNSDSKITWCASEKIHGCNARFTWADDKFHVGSKNRWVENNGKNVWARALDNLLLDLDSAQLEEFILLLKEYVLIGEVYGSVQDLHYGVPNDVRFIGFDLYSKKDCKFMPAEFVFITLSKIGIDYPQYMYMFDVTLEEAVTKCKTILNSGVKSYLAFANGDPEQIPEGLVLRPMESEMTVNASRGPSRLIVKVIGEEYHQRNNGTEHQE